MFQSVYLRLKQYKNDKNDKWTNSQNRIFELFTSFSSECQSETTQTIEITGTLMQFWKSPYMLVFILKQCPESFAFLVIRIIELFNYEVSKFIKN